MNCGVQGLPPRVVPVMGDMVPPYCVKAKMRLSEYAEKEKGVFTFHSAFTHPHINEYTHLHFYAFTHSRIHALTLSLHHSSRRSLREALLQWARRRSCRLLPCRSGSP